MDFGLVNDRHNLDMRNARLLHKDLLPEVGCQDFELYKGHETPNNHGDERGTARLPSGFQAVNCSPAAIEEFPKWPLDSNQRANGGIALNIIITLYLVAALAVVCDDYFVPALEMICDGFKLSSDVAGATFMAAGTSSPEFFTNIMGTFVTKSDLGIGTIVGSAVFNIFGVISVCGLFAGRKIPLHWYPITRDCMIYGLTVILLIVVLIDEKVYWYESLLMIFFYVGYIILMAFNGKIERWALSSKSSVTKRFQTQTVPNELTPLQSPTHHAGSRGLNNNGDGSRDSPSATVAATRSSTSPNATSSAIVNVTTTSSGVTSLPNQVDGDAGTVLTHVSSDRYNMTPTVKSGGDGGEEGGGESTRHNNSGSIEFVEGGSHAATTSAAVAIDNGCISQTEGDQDDDEEELLYPWQRPTDAGVWGLAKWVAMLPVNFLYFITIPDMRRRDPEGTGCTSTSFFQKLYPVAFVMCMAWIGAISYVVTWQITIIGVDLGIPDSVMGLSFLAIGTSIPEVFSSLIVCRQGKGSMAVSNSIGSNTFDILVCLGLPWLCKSLLNGVDGERLVRVNSEGLAYTVISLLLSLIVLYLILLLSKFELSRFTALVCLVIYAVFFTISVLFEMNIFWVVNDPTCPSDY